LIFNSKIPVSPKSQDKEPDSQPSEDSEQPKGFWYSFFQLIKYIIYAGLLLLGFALLMDSMQA